MSRRAIIALLALSLLYPGLLLSSLTVARAETDFNLQFNTTQGTNDSGEADTTEDAGAAKQVIATKADIRDMLLLGKVREAEASYLTWARYWQDDDLPLLAEIERAVLLNQYREGKLPALVDLVRAGDAEALSLLRTLVTSGTADLPSADLAATVRLLGERSDLQALNTLRILLYSKDAVVVNAAIDSLGKLGDKRAVPDLLKLLDGADPERSVTLAIALNALGARKTVVKRFTPQLRFQLPGVRENAALVLAALGMPDGWPILRQIAANKTEPYYPLVLSVLGALPSDESVLFVTQGLSGSEVEQLAALKSLALLSESKAQEVLLQKLRDPGQPATVRIACVNALVARSAPVAVRELWPLAKNEGDSPLVKAAALYTMPALGIMDQYMVRDIIRMRFDSAEEEVARAARAVMLAHAMKPR